MLEINLLPVREARRKADIRQQLMQLVLVLLLTLGAIGFWHSRVAEEISMSEVRVSQMQNDIQQFKPQLEQVAAFKLKKARLEKKIDVIDGLDRARSGPVHVLAELAEADARAPLADRARLEGGRDPDGRAAASTTSWSPCSCAASGESKYFDKVDLDSTQIVDGRDGLKVVKFAIRAQIVNPDAAAGSRGARRSGHAASGGEGRVSGGAPWKSRRSSSPGSTRSPSSRSRRGPRSCSESSPSWSAATTSGSTAA